MSRQYSRTFNNFSSEQKVRTIVQEQLQGFFSVIKSQIQRKIKQIDKNIIDIRSDLDKLFKNKPYELDEISIKIRKIEKMIQNLRQEKQIDLQRINQTIRTKSQQKDKVHLFKKTNNAPNLDSILFGSENNNISNHQQEKSPIRTKSPHIAKPKPPLPKMKNNKQDSKQQIQQNILSDFSRDITEVKRIHWQENFQNNYSSCSLNEEEENNNFGGFEQHKISGQRPNRIIESLNKNKNSFMRKKSQKKFHTIPQQEIEESLISFQE